MRHVRDDLYLRNPRQYAGSHVASRGIKFDLITGSPSSPDAPAAYVDTIATRLPLGSVESVEGTNEWDYFSHGDPDSAQALVSRQPALYAAVKAEPATRSLPVFGPALAFKRNYAALPDLSDHADVANAHMYAGGHQPGNEMGHSSALRTVVPTKPMVVTEAGYHNAVNTTNGHLAVPEDVAATYLPRLLLEHYLAGRSRVYTYELIDEFSDPGEERPGGELRSAAKRPRPEAGLHRDEEPARPRAGPGACVHPDGPPDRGHWLPCRAGTSSPRSGMAATSF